MSVNESEPNTVEVALFPIPDMVSFPGSTVPLHVFEPRYRSMIKHCEAESMMIAVTHTKKTITDRKRNISSVDELNQNLSTYEPHDVFGAGFCETIKVTADGRMHVIVKPTKRLKLIKVTQQVPFMVAQCEELCDEAENNLQLSVDRMGEINQLLQAISKVQSPELYQILTDHEWLTMSPDEFSFKLFKYFRFDADFMQHVLEQTSVINRLDMIWSGLQNSLGMR